MDEVWMQEALLEAEKAFLADEVPVGAVAVFEGNVIARAHNQVESLKDASAHAELLCLRKAADFIGNWRLTGVTLYSTLEPCMLCTGAIFSFRLTRVVWGAPDIRQGGDGSYLPLLSSSHPIHRVEVSRGVLADASSILLRSFFEQKRERNRGKSV
jgi:tRNA(adenine34) deaminase